MITITEIRPGARFKKQYMPFELMIVKYGTEYLLVELDEGAIMFSGQLTQMADYIRTRNLIKIESKWERSQATHG